MAIDPHAAAAKETFGWVKKIAIWIKDFGAAPGNLRRLAEAKTEDEDVRPKCRSCGEGRVGNVKSFANKGYIGVTGVCNTCSVVWNVGTEGKLISPTVNQHQR